MELLMKNKWGKPKSTPITEMFNNISIEVDKAMNDMINENAKKARSLKQALKIRMEEKEDG